MVDDRRSTQASPGAMTFKEQIQKRGCVLQAALICAYFDSCRHQRPQSALSWLDTLISTVQIRSGLNYSAWLLLKFKDLFGSGIGRLLNQPRELLMTSHSRTQMRSIGSTRSQQGRSPACQLTTTTRKPHTCFQMSESYQACGY